MRYFYITTKNGPKAPDQLTHHWYANDYLDFSIFIKNDMQITFFAEITKDEFESTENIHNPIT
jgi:hypothetical protein